mmetsp:Transcript_64344/g.158330  ORF Transcript_64344/g.158330 Transcript_64344/m.158330 type:complete len:248 (+) Transcript_64344:981-1724(+)
MGATLRDTTASSPARSAPSASTWTTACSACRAPCTAGCTLWPCGTTPRHGPRASSPASTVAAFLGARPSAPLSRSATFTSASASRSSGRACCAARASSSATTSGHARAASSAAPRAAASLGRASRTPTRARPSLRLPRRCRTRLTRSIRTRRGRARAPLPPTLPWTTAAALAARPLSPRTRLPTRFPRAAWPRPALRRRMRTEGRTARRAPLSSRGRESRDRCRWCLVQAHPCLWSTTSVLHGRKSS